ncbi:hypothetical protein LQZ18_07620 [Lachnospiraceae bacterium ZAX-1]
MRSRILHLDPANAKAKAFVDNVDNSEKKLYVTFDNGRKQDSCHSLLFPQNIVM